MSSKNCGKVPKMMKTFSFFKCTLSKAALTLFLFFVILACVYHNTRDDKYETKKSVETTRKSPQVVHAETVNKISHQKDGGNAMENMWKRVYEKKFTCVNKIYLGGSRENDTDGAYYLCKDESVWPVSNKKDPPCLVYSFGINWDFKFDDAIAATGCEVHSFDPSMNLTEGTKRESGVIFHKIGIGEKNDDNGFKEWKTRTLKTLMKELGHQNRVLDYLKVDTDKGDGTGFEDTIMQEILDSGIYKCIRQTAIEIHMKGPLYSEENMKRCELLESQLKSLEKGGFRLYQTVDNIRFAKLVYPGITQEIIKKEHFSGSEMSVLWESHFVNLNFRGKCSAYL